jgi:glycosyltransferase involved in cell wall biosynthesis
MRILVCSAYFESHRGGIEIVAGRLAREFGSLGHSVSWLSADARSPPARTGAGGRAVPLRASNVSKRWLQIPQPIPGLRAFGVIKREVARADVVHLHDVLYLVHLLALMSARWHGKPVVLTQDIDASPYRNRVLRLMMRAMIRLLTRQMLAGAVATSIRLGPRAMDPYAG